MSAAPAWGANAPQANVPETGIFGPVNLEFSTGFDYSVGRYGGTSDTTVFDIPFGAKFQAGDIRIEGSIPYLDIKGPGLSAGDIVLGRGSQRITERSGIGDLTLISGATVLRENDLIPGIEIAGTLKLPTAASGLGTGKTDFTVQANLFHTLTSELLLFGSLGYQWLGTSSALPLTSGVRLTAGVNYKPQDNIAAGVTLDYREKYEATLPDYLSLDPYVVWRFVENFGVSAYAIAGLTDAAPRFGIGGRLIFYQ